MRKLILTFCLALSMSSGVVVAETESNGMSTVYGVIYSSILATIVPTEFISSEMPTRISEMLSNLGGENREEFKAVRDDAIDYLATGRKSYTLNEVIQTVQSQEAGAELSSEQVASVIVGSVGI